MPLLKTRAEEASRSRVAAGAATDPQVAARVDALLRQVRARDLQPSPEVVRELQSMGDAAIAPLIAAMKRRRSRRPTLPWYAFLLLTGVPALLQPISVYPDFGWHNTAMTLNLLLLTARTAWHPWYPLRAADIRLLIRLKDVRTLAPLIDAYPTTQYGGLPRENRTTLTCELRAALLDLLPRLDAAGKDLLDDRHRRYLRRVLERAARNPYLSGEADTDLVFAAVKALVQIRDLESVETLRLLARKARAGDVRAIAARGVAELEARADR